MASFSKRGGKVRVEVCVDRRRRSKTFPTKREAVAWANEQEEDGILAQHTLRQALERYKPVVMTHKGSQSELSRWKALHNMTCIDTPLEFITPAVLSKWRDQRLTEVAPVSVRREMIILGAMFRVAIEEWGWARSNPLKTVKRPPTSAPRRRGVSQSEIDSILPVLLSNKKDTQVADMFLLSIETGMRLSEMLDLQWGDVSDKTVTLHDTKNSDGRQVPLSIKARGIVEGRKNIDPEKVFTLTDKVVSKRFQRARTAAGCPSVHFHDARSEAVTRLSKKLDVMQLARVIGHRDIKSLMIYYAESADQIADRLN